MKKFRSYFILILAAAVMTSCSGLNKMKKNSNLVKYEVTPKVLQADGGLVTVTIKGTYPEKYFDKKTTVTLTPVLTYAGGETAFDKVQVVQGESVQANNKVISYSGGDFTYTSSVPYKDAMKISELQLQIKAERGSKAVDFDPVKLADGVIATATLVEKHGKPIIMKDKFQRITPESQMADIHYIINRYDLQSKELKAEDIALLKQYIADVNTDPDREFKNTVVSSYASPDGSMKINAPLSEKRGVTADKFIKKEFKSIDAANSADFFDEMTTPEDWDGFKSLVENSSMQDKDLILRVLSMYSDPDVREKEIKNMSAAFEILKTDILPKLRRSKMTVNVDKIGRTDEQILAAINSDPKVLTVDEMLYAATLTKDLNQQLKYYQIAAQNFPKCIRAHNDAGCTLLALGKVDDATAELEAAKAIQNNDVVKNNLGFCALVKGDIPAAEGYFTSMSAATPESKWGLGVVAITKGEYDKAVNLLGTEPCTNLAIAQILKGDVNRAKATMDGMTETCKSGKPQYIKAVIGARLDDKSYMLAGLKEACAMNADWKAYAKTDIEFAKYFNDGDFKAIVQ
jgi:tetratricopeptide (TPR) repeat protein